MKIVATLLAGAMACLPGIASAQTYVTGFGGWDSPSEPTIKMKTNRLQPEVQDGWTGGVAAGYDWDWGKAEIEASMARSTVTSINANRGNFLATNRSYRLRRSALVNAYVTPRLSQDVKLVFGAGAGVAQLTQRTKVGPDCGEIYAYRIVRNDPNVRQAETGNGTCKDQGDSRNINFTYQLIGGLDLNAGKGWSISPQVRWSNVLGVGTAAKSLPTRETRFIDNLDYNSVSAVVGLTKRF